MTDWMDEEAARTFASLRRRLDARLDLKPKRQATFFDRLEAEYERIFRLAHELYGWRWDFAWHLEEILAIAGAAAGERAKWLRKRDESGHAWLYDGHSIWATTYVDRFVGGVRSLGDADRHLDSLRVSHLHLLPPYRVPDGPDDGGYAVSSYRHLRDGLGKIDDLRSYIARQHEKGRGVVLDVVANHTADDHPWAKAAKRGEEPYASYYLLFDRREEVDEWVPHLRMIFPDAGEPFVWRPDVSGPHGGRWVWSTFFDFQWDLDYRNPEVLGAMLRETLFLANLGVAALQINGSPFLWKRKGTSCENLPQSHVVLQLMAAVVAVVAPSVVLLSDATVHPSATPNLVHPEEFTLGYNSLLMALIWEALATGRVEMLADALAMRMELSDGAQWLTHLRTHDDIGWGFDDEDADRLGIDPAGHRAFLTSFYAGEHEHSWSAGARFQENPVTGDVRIVGTTASLAGLERAVESGDEALIDLAVSRIIAGHTVVFTAIGIPMLVLGDEIASTNDYRYLEDPTRRDDNRWMHRPRYSWDRLGQAESDPTSPQGRVLAAMRRLVELRTEYHHVFGLADVEVIGADHPSVLAYRRSAGDDLLMVIASFSPDAVVTRVEGDGEVWADAFDTHASWSGGPIDLEPYQSKLLIRRR